MVFVEIFAFGMKESGNAFEELTILSIYVLWSFTMCGIIGYKGGRRVSSILIKGLKRMEYRGYDSSGIAVAGGGALSVLRSVGKIEKLEEKFDSSPIDGDIGIGHSRWATHGVPSERNAHPHRDCSGKIAVVHNGIIENFRELREMLEAKGHVFQSDTDTETAAHLLEEFYEGDLEQAMLKTVRLLKGAFSLVAISSDEPDRIVFARLKSPLVVGMGRNEYFVASDVIAFLEYTREALYLEDAEMGVVTDKGVSIRKFSGEAVSRKTTMILWNADMAEKNGFKHFMLKEIYEQPEGTASTLSGILDGDRISLGVDLSPENVRNVKRISIVACGTAYNAGLLGKYFIEKIAKIPVDIDVASEFIYRENLISDDTLFIAVSQSGETADTREAAVKAHENGARTIAVTNVVGSSITREVDGVIYTRTGFEMGVAATKTFTAQSIVMYVLALRLAECRGLLSENDVSGYIRELRTLPDRMKDILADTKNIKRIARMFHRCRDFLFLGRNANYPLALEGALKLKEISYIHAEGYAAGEMKHGPIALIDENCPVVVLMVNSDVYDKVISNVREVSARKGKVIGIVSDSDENAASFVHSMIKIPSMTPFVSSILAVLPLQLLSYYIADVRECDIDKPRNLAKSVTVE